MFGDTEAAFANWGGQWYTKIALTGYSYDSEQMSSVAFFPVYPLIGCVIAKATGLEPVLALLVISNVSLAASFVFLLRYIKIRFEGGPRLLCDYTLLALGLMPTTFFFRMVYSDALFLLLTTLFLYGAQRQWPLVTLAGIVGLSTATRPVGIGLIPPLLLLVWQLNPIASRFIRHAVYLVPIACWGIIGYIMYQWCAFGEPLAFVQTKVHWRVHPPRSLPTKLIELLTFEPIWRLFDPDCPGYWWKLDTLHSPFLNLHLAEPFYFLASVGLILLGAARRWLNPIETLLSLSLLVIPYVTNGYDTYMVSMGRYTSVAVPVYLVLGRLLCSVPPPLASILLSICGFLMGVYTATFAAWYTIL